MNGLMYLIRILALCLIVALTVLLCKKKTVRILVPVLAFVIIAISIVFPPESFLVHFNTPEKAFQYTNYRNEKIVDVLYGEESVMVISARGKDCSYGFLRKENDGYRILPFGSSETIREKTGDMLKTIERVKGTNDHYVIVLSGTKDLQIDGAGDNVKCIEISPKVNYMYCYCYKKTDTD